MENECRPLDQENSRAQSDDGSPISVSDALRQLQNMHECFYRKRRPCDGPCQPTEVARNFDRPEEGLSTLCLPKDLENFHELSPLYSQFRHELGGRRQSAERRKEQEYRPPSS